MKKRAKKAILVISIIIVFIGGVFFYNKLQLEKEAGLRQPLGDIVYANGHDISVYTEGSGDKTLLFLSGGGTCSPILDFKSLFSKLSDEYRIVVVERLGYGFSESAKAERDIGSILSDTRSGLEQAGISGPFILCPHSMAGIEAIYWAQEYPKEVEGVIGLDMATPYHYEKMNINMFSLYLSRFALVSGFARLLPWLWKGEAVKHGTLTQHEKDIYKAVFYDKSVSGPMIKEAGTVKKNAAFVLERGLPQIPLMMFVSNGKGTGFSKDEWRDCSARFVDKVNNGMIVNIDCPHYVHDYAYDDISEEIRMFAGAL